MVVTPNHDSHNDQRGQERTPVTVLWPFADHRDLYVLVAGIVLGVLLGPAVLGRVAPQTYERLFVGGAAEARELARFEAATERLRESLIATDVSPVALQELESRRFSESAPLHARWLQVRQAHADWLRQRATGIVLAVLAIMVIEAVVGSTVQGGERTKVPPALARLVRVRYALAALWIAMLLAAPSAVGGLPVLFVALLLVVALVLGLMPLGSREPADV